VVEILEYFVQLSLKSIANLPGFFMLSIKDLLRIGFPTKASNGEF